MTDQTETNPLSSGAEVVAPGTSDKTLYIIDGHSQVFKAYHAIQRLSTSTGIPTNAVYGFVQILQKLLKTRNPEYLLVTFDSGGETFRHQMYTEYKANRAAPPDDFAPQMKYIIDILEAMRIPILQKPGYEADDIIATVATCAMNEGFKVVVVTADKDLFQLVCDNLYILRLEPDKETEFTREAVKEKMGVYPEQIADMLALIGDTSDNIPGVRKIGPKTAASLLAEFGNLETVLNSTTLLKGKQREYIETDIENARLSRRLVELDYKCPVDYCCDNFKRQLPDAPKLMAIYKALEFRRLLEDVDLGTADRETRYRILTTREELIAYTEEIRAAGRVGVDVETDGLAPMVSKPVGVSMSVRANDAVYVPVGHVGPMGSAVEQLSVAEVREILAPVFADPSIEIIAHNMKFDWKVLRNMGIEPHELGFDTLIASYVVNPDRRAHGLKDLAADLLGIKMTRIEDLIGTGRNQITFDQVDLKKGGEYAAADADMTLQLADILRPRLLETGQMELFKTIELPLVGVLMEMELTGVCIDVPYFAKLGNEMHEHLERIRARIYELVGHEFNIGSPKQVAGILFDELQLKPVKTKKTGHSTDVEVLEELSQYHEVPCLLMEYRQFEKLKSTYVDVLPTLICRPTGRIHTSYNQAVAATGRLSSSDPNLQNIPVRTEWGRKIRRGFIPSDPENNVLLSADYSQIELRVLAHITCDEALVKAFREDTDVHTLTASKVFGKSPAEVTSEMRDRAKMINFGIIYGMSAQGLSQRLKIPLPDAKVFIEEYFKAYCGVHQWIQSTLESARALNFVTTVSGRRRYLPDINSRNFNLRNAAERVAVNAPIQGTSADMIKIAMTTIYHELERRKLRTRMIMQVHDELIFDTPEVELEEVKALVLEHMQQAIKLTVPVKVDMHTGKNWEEC